MCLVSCTIAVGRNNVHRRQLSYRVISRLSDSTSRSSMKVAILCRDGSLEPDE